MSNTLPGSKVFGAKRTLPDDRFEKYRQAMIQKIDHITPPDSFYLHGASDGAFNQYTYDNCVANAISKAISLAWKQNNPGVALKKPSRMMIYYYERVADGEGTGKDVIKNNVGGNVAPTLDQFRKKDIGMCDEGDNDEEGTWPYGKEPAPELDNETVFGQGKGNSAVNYPPNLGPEGYLPIELSSYAEIAGVHPGFYYDERNLEQVILPMKKALAAGYPFVFGMQLYWRRYADSPDNLEYVGVPTTAPKEGILKGPPKPVKDCDDQARKDAGDAKVHCQHNPPRDCDYYDGGHEMAIVGYKTDPSIPGGGSFTLINSWGQDWGTNGRLEIPFEYFKYPKYVDDCFAIEVNHRDWTSTKG